jgi:hypothetical protein
MDARAAEILAMGKKVGATRDKIALLCVNEVNEARKEYVWQVLGHGPCVTGS